MKILFDENLSFKLCGRLDVVGGATGLQRRPVTKDHR
jgi:hypothetical protein